MTESHPNGDDGPDEAEPACPLLTRGTQDVLALLVVAIGITATWAARPLWPDDYYPTSGAPSLLPPWATHFAVFSGALAFAVSRPTPATERRVSELAHAGLAAALATASLALAAVAARGLGATGPRLVPEVGSGVAPEASLVALGALLGLAAGAVPLATARIRSRFGGETRTARIAGPLAGAILALTWAAACLVVALRLTLPAGARFSDTLGRLADIATGASTSPRWPTLVVTSLAAPFALEQLVRDWRLRKMNEAGAIVLGTCAVSGLLLSGVLGPPLTDELLAFGMRPTYLDGSTSAFLVMAIVAALAIAAAKLLIRHSPPE